MIQTQKLESLELEGGARSAQDEAPHRVGNLDGRRADAAGRGVHQNALAGGEPALGQQGVVGRDECLGNRRGLYKVEVGRNRHCHPLVRQNVLGLAAAGNDAEDSVSRLESTDRVGTQRIHLAGKLQPGDVCRSARRGGIMTPALQQIGPVQAAGAHPD